MLPFLGHSVVVLSNEEGSPARYALTLTLLDALLGLEPPQPSWSERFFKRVMAPSVPRRRRLATACGGGAA